MTQFQLRKRREQIASLLLREFSIVEISKQLDMPVQSVYNDLKIIRKENEHYIQTNQNVLKNVVNNILNMLKKYKEMEIECWKKYMDSNETDKRGYLNTLRGIYQDVAKLLKLIDIKNVNIEKIVNINHFTPILNKISIIIDRYVPENQRLRAIEELKDIELPE